MSRLVTFQESLDAHRVDWTRTGAATFEDTLTAVVDEPAVGTPLPFDGVTCDGTPVTVDPTPAQLSEARTGVTAVTYAVADYGSVIVESGTEGAEQVSLYPEHHVAVLRESDVLPDMAAAFDRLQDRFDGDTTSAVLATGPSATADMGVLVYGAHGPREVTVVVLEDR